MPNSETAHVPVIDKEVNDWNIVRIRTPVSDM